MIILTEFIVVYSIIHFVWRSNLRQILSRWASTYYLFFVQISTSMKTRTLTKACTRLTEHSTVRSSDCRNDNQFTD